MAVELQETKQTQRNRDMNPTITKPDHQDLPPSTAAPAWGTWEELLLAYAVNRYGTKNWTSISYELQKRSSDPIHITPLHCEQKYDELKRRFSDVVLDDVTETGETAAVPWLDELRKVRVLELQQELRNYDLYISSLQTKVKQLTEESEKTGGDLTKNFDLGHRNVEIESDTANTTPEPAVSGDLDTEPENQSVNGSNGNLETGDNKPESGNGVKTGGEKSEPEGEQPVRSEPAKSEPRSESMGESKSEGKNSDVRSSASKLRNERVPRGDCKEDDECTDSIPVRSLPLVDLLHKVQKLGSVVFERRLDRQEKLRYNNLIKQHIDHNTLQTRLKQGYYSDGNHKFFRDLLLLVNNTRIFFPKQSPESIAAVDLRQLILKELIKITNKKQKASSNMPPNRAADPPDSLLLKPKLAGPIVVCRKRSSITAKAAGSSSGKKEQMGSKEKLIEENPKKKGRSNVNESSDSRPEKKKKLTEAEEKKQGAAKFLNRIKRSNESLLSTSKSVSERSGGDGKKDQAGRKSSSGHQLKEQGSPAKRNVGRPPKRAAAPPTLAAVLGKRNREPVDSETLGLKQTKKRSKR
ncbi:putative transcription factor MYB-related family [Helianthus anomalus]